MHKRDFYIFSSNDARLLIHVSHAKYIIAIRVQRTPINRDQIEVIDVKRSGCWVDFEGGVINRGVIHAGLLSCFDCNNHKCKCDEKIN